MVFTFKGLPDVRCNGIVPLLLIAFLLSCQQSARAQKLISPEELKKVVDDPGPNQVLLDVRTPDEVSRGIIPGALHMDFHNESFQKESNAA